MEIPIDSPGDREYLEHHQILKPGESTISIDDLVTRTLEKSLEINENQVEPVMSVLKQHLANKQTNLVLIDDSLRRVQKAASEIHDKESLQNVQNRVNTIETILDKARELGIGIPNAASAIIEKIESDTKFKSLLTTNVTDDYETIIKIRNEIIKTLSEKEDSIHSNLENIYSDMDMWRNKFQSSEK